MSVTVRRISLPAKTAASLSLAVLLSLTPAGADSRSKLFADPTNIDLNLQYLQQQIAAGNYKGAAATLQRVLLLDPGSRFAKILYADIQIKLGNWSDAKRILAELLADPALPHHG